MDRFTRLMGRYDAETKTFTAAATNKAGTAAQALYTPDFNATLVGLRCMEGGGAATNLMNHVNWKLTCTTFKPESLEVGMDGAGLMTAPKFPVPPVEWPVNQQVKSSIGITIEARNLTADTPVGVDTFLYGIFDM